MIPTICQDISAYNVRLSLYSLKYNKFSYRKRGIKVKRYLLLKIKALYAKMN